MKTVHLCGVSSSAKMASTGHAGTQAPQSMHSSGMNIKHLRRREAGSSFRGWMQSTGQTSTQAVSFVPMHGSQMIYAIGADDTSCTRRREWRHGSATPPSPLRYARPQPPLDAAARVLGAAARTLLRPRRRSRVGAARRHGRSTTLRGRVAIHRRWAPHGRRSHALRGRRSGVRSWRTTAAGQIESVTLISPAPDDSATRLDPGTIIVIRRFDP